MKGDKGDFGPRGYTGDKVRAIKHSYIVFYASCLFGFQGEPGPEGPVNVGQVIQKLTTFKIAVNSMYLMLASFTFSVHKRREGSKGRNRNSDSRTTGPSCTNEQANTQTKTSILFVVSFLLTLFIAGRQRRSRAIRR